MWLRIQAANCELCCHRQFHDCDAATGGIHPAVELQIDALYVIPL